MEQKYHCCIEKLFLIKDFSDTDMEEEGLYEEGEFGVTEVRKPSSKAEVSFNAVTGVPKPSTMRLMVWNGLVIT